MACIQTRSQILFSCFFLYALQHAFTVLALVFLIVYILVKGIPNLSLDLFAVKYTTQNVSLLPALINTLFIMILSLLFAVPVGIGAAVYLTEYARRSTHRNRLIFLVDIAVDTLSGIPSIVYGLFGSLFL